MDLGIGARPEDLDNFGALMNMPGLTYNAKRTGYIVLGLVIVFLTSMVLSPRYLVYDDRPAKSDIIVLFVGSDRDSRLREVVQLLQEGYSDYLFIPVTFGIYKAWSGKGGITAIRFTDIRAGIDLPGPRPEQEMTDHFFRKNWTACRFPRFYEATHVEMLLAKKAMDACRFRKAIFVSSPYHMKRIKIIANRVFDSFYDIKCIPTRFEKSFKIPLTAQNEIRNATSEITKIIWFCCYDLWERCGFAEAGRGVLLNFTSFGEL